MEVLHCTTGTFDMRDDKNNNSNLVLRGFEDRTTGTMNVSLYNEDQPKYEFDTLDIPCQNVSVDKGDAYSLSVVRYEHR